MGPAEDKGTFVRCQCEFDDDGGVCVDGEAQWRTLLDSVGLRISKSYTYNHLSYDWLWMCGCSEGSNAALLLDEQREAARTLPCILMGGQCRIIVWWLAIALGLT